MTPWWNGVTWSCSFYRLYRLSESVHFQAYIYTVPCTSLSPLSLCFSESLSSSSCGVIDRSKRQRTSMWGTRGRGSVSGVTLFFGNESFSYSIAFLILYVIIKSRLLREFTCVWYLNNIIHYYQLDYYTSFCAYGTFRWCGFMVHDIILNYLLDCVCLCAW